MTPKFAKMKELGEDPSAESRTMQCAPQVKRKEKKKKNEDDRCTSHKQQQAHIATQIHSQEALFATLARMFACQLAQCLSDI